MGTWSFQYDVLNRLVSGTASAGTYKVGSLWDNLCWAYDRGPHGQVFVRGVEDDFGNRTIESEQTSACSNAGSFAPTLVFNASNRLSGVIPPGGSRQSPPTLTYDAAGDVTQDSQTGNQYVYDAEGRICAFATPNGLGGTIMMGYLYNAEGSRVAKGTIATMNCDPATNGFTLTGSYVLGQGGEELTQLNGSGVWQRTNVYGGGRQLATYDLESSPELHFQLTDPLGTRRMQTDAYGRPETDIQSLPYGDGLSPAPDQYAPATADDATPLHFTGKERDAESGNDDFGARYYASSMGRMLSPDPSQLYYADPTNPQSLNLYSYVRNNPLINIDPTGMSCDSSNPDNDESCEDNQDNQYDSSMYSQQMYSQQMSDPPQVVPDPNNPGGYRMKVDASGTPLDGCYMSDPLCRMEYQEIMAWLAQRPLRKAPNNVPHTAVAGSIDIPTPIPGLIIAIPLAYIPSTGKACIGIGGGVGTPGASGGVIYSDANIQNVLEGPSISGSSQAGFWGVQGMRNSSGAAVGNSMGSPGSAITGTVSWCF